MSDTKTLARMAASQFSLLTTPQLHACGLADSELKRMRREGRLTLYRPGLYVLGKPDGSYKQSVMAACLYAHTTACASHMTAAHLWGLWERTSLEVTLRYPQNATAAGVTVHRSRDLSRLDVTHIDGIPITNPTRTLCDLGLVLPEEQVCRLLDHAIGTGLVQRGRVEQVRIRISAFGRNGVGVIGRALDSLPEGAERTESGPEVDILRAIEELGLPAPTPQWWVSARGRPYRIDVAYPEQKVAIEYDGADWHSSAQQINADRRRQAAIESIGWLFIRVRRNDLQLGGRAALRFKIQRALERL